LPADEGDLTRVASACGECHPVRRDPTEGSGVTAIGHPAIENGRRVVKVKESRICQR
jgi:hypothetical protein